jgi:hypothetical protein
VGGEFAISVVPEVDVGHSCIPNVLHTTVGQPLNQRAYDRIVLIIPSVVEQILSCHIWEQMHESQQVASHFNGAVPWFKGKECFPHVPEILCKEVLREDVADTLIVRRSFRFGSQREEL